MAFVGACVPLAVVAFVAVYALFMPILLPALALMLWLARWWGQVHRRLAKRLLDIEIAPPPPEPRPAGPGVIDWTVAHLRDGAGWRAVAFATLQLPYAILMAGAGAGAWLYAVGGIAAPLTAGVRPPLGPADELMSTVTGATPWWLDLFLGVLLLFAAPWVVHGMVRLDLVLMNALLGRRRLAERVRDLEQSRALAVDDAAATLRRIERDLHDGTQARLVALAMDLTMVRERLREESLDLAAARDLVDAARTNTKAAIGELRDLARGIHPQVLDRGLTEALQTLAAHSPVPVIVNADLPRRPAPAIETIAYFCASELVANVVRHSGARSATVDIAERDESLELRVSDDGVGGAGTGTNSGTGLSGLADRVRTVDGVLTVSSPVGGPTVITVRLPWHALPGTPRRPGCES